MELLKAELVHGDPAVLHVVGELDMLSADQLRTALNEALSTNSAVVVDMAGVTFCDASGLRVLLQVAESRNGAGPLTLFHAARVTRLLELVGLTGLSSIVIGEEGDPDGR